MRFWVDPDELRALRAELDATGGDVAARVRRRVRVTRASLLLAATVAFTLAMALTFYGAAHASSGVAPALLIGGYVLGCLPVVLAARASFAMERASLLRALPRGHLAAVGGLASTVAVGTATRR